MKWKYGEIRALLKSARTIYRSRFLYIAIAPMNSNQSRLVVIAPKFVGSAPQRNRCKRRVREFVRKYVFSRIQCDMIVFIRKNFSSLKDSDLQVAASYIVSHMTA